MKILTRAFLAISLFLLPASSLLPEENSPARNLGLSGSIEGLSGDWLVLRIREPSQGMDLNGDGDTLDEVAHVHDLRTGRTKNLGLAGSVDVLPGNRLALRISEGDQGEDLNGDGDAEDLVVVHVHDLPSGVTTNLGLAGEMRAVSENWLVLEVTESGQGGDLNRDGDADDEVVHVHDLQTGRTTNLSLAGAVGALSGNWLAFEASEGGQGEDLNHDGDIQDGVVHVHDLERGRTTNLALAGGVEALSESWLVLGVSEGGQGEDLNQDGDVADRIWHIHDVESGKTTNLGLAGGDQALAGERLVLEVLEGDQGEDLNRDGDIQDGVVHVHNLQTGETTNLELAGPIEDPFEELSGSSLVLWIPEARQGADLNGDGDAEDDGVIHVHNLQTGMTTNLGLVGEISVLSERWLVLEARESSRGEDLNGDSDTEDVVVHVHDLQSGETTNLGLAGGVGAHSGNWIVFGVLELHQGEDLNQDGDAEDYVIHVHNLQTGETKNLMLSGSAARLENDWLMFQVAEWQQGEILNGDDDTHDVVVHVHDLETARTTNLGLCGSDAALSANWLVLAVWEPCQGQDLNLDGDIWDGVFHIHDRRTGRTTNLRLPGSIELLTENWLVLGAWEPWHGQDLNGDGDAEDTVVHVYDLSSPPVVPQFIRGDCNDDGAADISDGVCILDWLFLGGAEPGCVAATNTNGTPAADGIHPVDLTDAVYLFRFLFLGGPPPVEPFPNCGPGTVDADDALGCVVPSKACQ